MPAFTNEIEGRGTIVGENGAGQSVRGLLQDEYSEEAYLLDDVDDGGDGVLQEANQVGNFGQQMTE